MDEFLATVARAFGVFAGTNVDDIVVLTVLFLTFRANGKPKWWHIWVGQYIGVGALIAISVIAALGLTIVPDQWVGLIGLVPFALGVRGLVKAIRARHDEEPPVPGVATGLASVIGVTMANGADNISIYTPMFRAIGTGATITTIIVFLIGIGVWCFAGNWLGSHRRVIEIVQRFGHWIVPVVFMLIGAIIVIESDVLGRIVDSALALSAYSPEQIEAFWTGVGALAAVAASVVAIVTLGALRHDSTDRTRPMLYAELRPVLLVTIPRRALVLRNGGATPAQNVRVTFDPPLPAFDEPGDDQKMTRFLKRRYEKTIATWPPGMELSNLYFIGVSGPNDHWVNEEPVPDEFTVTIRYQDTRGRSYSDSYALDDRVWPDETSTAPSGTSDKDLQKREVRAVEAIARGVGQH